MDAGNFGSILVEERRPPFMPSESFPQNLATLLPFPGPRNGGTLDRFESMGQRAQR